MHGLLVEKHSLNGKSLPWNLARHIYAWGQQGKLAVVAERPEVLLSTTRKEWLKLLRLEQSKRSGTLNPAQVGVLTERIHWMQGLTFTCKAPDDQLEADITFATAEDFVRVPPVCNCILITYAFEREKLHMLTAWMPRNGLVVIYE